MNVKFRVAGRYKIEKVKPDGERVVAADWFDNLITDSGLDLIGSTGNFLNACAVGTGSTPPAFTDTALESFLAEDSTVVDNDSGSDVAGGFVYARKIYQFNAGVATGNVSEVGVGANFSSQPIFSRALIKDSGGNPTTITILADEILQITYECRTYWQTGTFTGSTVGGIAWTAQPIWVSAPSVWSPPGYKVAVGNSLYCKAYTGGLPADGDIERSYPEGTAHGISGVTTDAYVPGSHEITGEMFWNISSANDVLKSFSFKINGGGAWAFELDSETITKTSKHELRVKVKASWGRY